MERGDRSASRNLDEERGKEIIGLLHGLSFGLLLLEMILLVVAVWQGTRLSPAIGSGRQTG